MYFFQCYTNQVSYKSPENLQEKNIAKNQEVNLQSRLLKVTMVTRPMPHILMENYFDPKIFVLFKLTFKHERNLKCLSWKVLKACLTKAREHTCKVKDILCKY